MKILIGTTNPSKAKRFQALLTGYRLEFCTLGDLGITQEPRETGNNPEENARIKAAFYGSFFEPVICNDSGLYFDTLPLADPRQPGLNIRTPQGCSRLDDEEMIAYYSKLVHSLGGKVLAYYLNGVAIQRGGRIFSFLESPQAARDSAFYMVDTPSEKRHIGWPLDSLSLHRNTMTYFVDKRADTVPEPSTPSAYQEQLTRFLAEALGLG